MTGSEGKSELCFSENLNLKVEGNIEIRGPETTDKFEKRA